MSYLRSIGTEGPAQADQFGVCSAATGTRGGPIAIEAAGQFAGWITDVTPQRAAALARGTARPARSYSRRRRSKASSTCLAISETSIATPIRQTRHSSTKTRVEATYQPGKHLVHATANIALPRGVMDCVRGGGLNQLHIRSRWLLSSHLGAPMSRSCGRMLSRCRAGAPGQIELGMSVSRQLIDIKVQWLVGGTTPWTSWAESARRAARLRPGA